jgi:hypothetical protein
VSSWPLVKFVDSPSASATVRFDCNDRQAAAPRKATVFDPGVPTLEGDPGSPGQQWGFRSPSLTVLIKGSKAAALAALSLLAREQLRRTNWVLVQLSKDTQPLWLKTYRTGYESLSLDRVYVRTSDGGRELLPDTWEVRVPLVAEAFFYGARVTHSAVTVTQSPTGTNPMKVVLPAILGDAPTPLRVAVTPASGTTGQFQDQWQIGCISGSSTLTDGILGAAAMTSVGASTVQSGAAYFNSQYRQVTTWISAGLTVYLTGTMPTLPRGRYELQMRCAMDGIADVDKSYTFRVTFLDSNGFAMGKGQPTTVVIPGKAVAFDYRGWVSLGEFPVPFGAGASVPDGVTVTTAGAAFGIDMKADDSTGTVRVDAIRAIPISGPTVSSANLLTANLGIRPISGTMIGTWDGDEETYWSTTSANALREADASLCGGFPVADPAAEKNMLILTALMTTSQGGNPNEITYPGASVQVVVSYQPRYLNPGDGS